MTVPVAVVAAEIRKRLPGIDDRKLHALLYYCQGHHLAHTGEPMFPETIHAVDDDWRQTEEPVTSPS